MRIAERHRHRYEFNNTYRELFSTEGMIFSGLSPDGELVEIQMPDKLRAAELDAKLSGELSENGVSLNIGLNLVNERLLAIDEKVLPRDAVNELPAKAEGTPKENPLNVP
jgi:hypothetical protein